MKIFAAFVVSPAIGIGLSRLDLLGQRQQRSCSEVFGAKLVLSVAVMFEALSRWQIL